MRLNKSSSFATTTLVVLILICLLSTATGHWTTTKKRDCTTITKSSRHTKTVHPKNCRPTTTTTTSTSTDTAKTTTTTTTTITTTSTTTSTFTTLIRPTKRSYNPPDSCVPDKSQIYNKHGKCTKVVHCNPVVTKPCPKFKTKTKTLTDFTTTTSTLTATSTSTSTSLTTSFTTIFASCIASGSPCDIFNPGECCSQCCFRTTPGVDNFACCSL
ncbi:hypothetical protein C1646_715518 [Rhizophagus diaphanus]|nr:hypothetical protein C1646_715518 [Rhizophagus diaphanus] [Rhizophagus sp. MUCL 43196]